MNDLVYKAKRSSTVKQAAVLLSLVIALVAGSLPLFSQAAVGTILGGVFDSAGGAIAGAQVTIIDVARGTTRTLTTDAAGEYSAPSLLSGTYTVRAAAKGFQTTEHSNVLLEVASDVRVDLTLSPGEQTQTVTVTAEAPAIDTTNATLGGTVTNQAVVSLPLVNRNFLQLLQLRPGVVDVPGGNGNSTATNGRREGADVLLIEGVTQFDLATSNVLINGAQKGGAVDQLPLDSVQEFSTQQNAPAEYGWRDGSAINVAVKSGTNNIHGSAYAFGRDAAATDAKQFSAINTEAVGNTTFEQPGFTLGGPILKNKLFWFVSGEFIRQDAFDPASYTVPSDVAGGTLSMVTTCMTLGPTKVNALSAQMAGITNYGQAGGTGPFCVPQQATSTIENLFPYNPTTSSQILPHDLTSTPSNSGLAKVDYDINEHHHLDGFYYISRETTNTGSPYQPYWATLGVGSTNEYAGAWTWTPNSRWVNDLRGGAAPNSGNSVASDTGRYSCKRVHWCGHRVRHKHGRHRVRFYVHGDHGRFPDQQWPGELRQKWYPRAAIPTRFHGQGLLPAWQPHLQIWLSNRSLFVSMTPQRRARTVLSALRACQISCRVPRIAEASSPATIPISGASNGMPLSPKIPGASRRG